MKFKSRFFQFETGPEDKRILSAIPPVVLAIIATVFQVVGYPLTQKELALSTGIQFLCSLWIGWIISAYFSEKGFEEKQKKFAISAYRRIWEIEYSVDRLIKRVQNQPLPKEYPKLLSVIKEIGLNLQSTVLSSKADWGEIIGKEITTLEKIERARRNEFSPVDDEVAEKTEDLLGSLPQSLQIQAQEFLNSQERLRGGIESLQDELDAEGYIELGGFWDSTFERDVMTLKIGDSVFVSLDDDAAGRVGTLLAHDKDGKLIGVVTNKIGTTYRQFVEAIMKVLGRSKFKAELIELGPIYKSKKGPEKEKERHYFKIKVVK